MVLSKFSSILQHLNIVNRNSREIVVQGKAGLFGSRTFYNYYSNNHYSIIISSFKKYRQSAKFPVVQLLTNQYSMDASGKDVKELPDSTVEVDEDKNQNSLVGSTDDSFEANQKEDEVKIVNEVTSNKGNEECNTTNSGSGDDSKDSVKIEEDDEVIVISDNEEEKFTVSEVLIELDDNLKSKLVADLVQICEVEVETARNCLDSHRWNMQDSIDFLLYANNSDEDDKMDTFDPDNPQTSSSPGEGASTSAAAISSSSGAYKLPEACSPGSDSKKEVEVEMERNLTLPTTPGGSFTNWAPEKFSVLSWNLDGLDDRNLERRMEYVIQIVEQDKHDVIFFQELLPYTFELIARKLISNYHPIPGTEDSACEYLTATFLRKNSVHYEDHFVMPFPNTAMGRTLLVTKAFIGRAKLALINSHLESTAEFSKQRTAQLKTAFEISSTFDKEYNVIFGGDLNLRDKEVAGNLPSSMCDVWVQCGSRKTCEYTWDLTRNTNKQMPSKFQPRCRFDRFFYRNSDPLTLNPEFFGLTGIEKVPQTASFPSDHWGIISFYALTKEARKPPRKRKAEEDEID